MLNLHWKIILFFVWKVYWFLELVFVYFGFNSHEHPFSIALQFGINTGKESEIMLYIHSFAEQFDL